MRQTFLPFSTPLNPQAPTEQQRDALLKARSISTSVHSCDQMEQVAKANNSPRPANPGDVRLDGVNPPETISLAFRAADQYLDHLCLAASHAPNNANISETCQAALDKRRRTVGEEVDLSELV